MTTLPTLGEWQPIKVGDAEQWDSHQPDEPETGVDAPRALAVLAAVATVVLTGIAFWLSFEHLHDVAHGNGLGGDEVRAWAWPATVDLFIVIGEVLMLRSQLRGQGVDWWAVSLMASGSLGSIALNVAGVGAEADGDPGSMEYVVAAVPPVAALLAFGALMRQLHAALAPRSEGAPETLTEADDERAHDMVDERVQEPTGERAQSTGGEREDERPEPRRSERARKPSGERRERARKAAKKSAKVSASKPSPALRRERARRLYDELGRRPEWTEIRDVLAAEGLVDKDVSRPTIQRVRDAIEREEPALAALGTDNVRALADQTKTA
ncbi:DUF2637 domain-containing protein [Streptomyces sp. NRRL S-1868]|uniref:DUF2637 domain-containing protein n=1 Tax=Streptomyces sp. NRRL S-1868 TaxID=1463892 RepID=UPI000690826D|nr:DUF2637 domain-containing protein [Streptomyces sp. NRRL S-1868]